MSFPARRMIYAGKRASLARSSELFKNSYWSNFTKASYSTLLRSLFQSNTWDRLFRIFKTSHPSLTVTSRNYPYSSTSFAWVLKTSPGISPSHTCLNNHVKLCNPNTLARGFVRYYASCVSVNVPPLAESLSEGTLKKFTKNVGDFVEQDAEVATLETDKVDISVNSPESGIIREFLVSEGDTVAVGQEILKLEPCTSAPQSSQLQTLPDTSEPHSQESNDSSDGEIITVRVPFMAESISEGSLKQFTKNIGDFIKQDEEIASIETDKIDIAINSPATGTLEEFLVKPGDTVRVDQEILRLVTGNSSNIPVKSNSSNHEIQSATSIESAAVATTQQKSHSNQAITNDTRPVADKIESGDVRSHDPVSPVKLDQKNHAPEMSSLASTASLQTISSNRTEKRVKMNRMRLRIAERLKQSQNTAASLTTFNEVDMSSVIEFRKLFKDEVMKNSGVKLGFVSLFARASILAMRDIPSINASIEGPNGGDTIIYRDYVDLSIAVATPKGLVTPVIRNAESLDIISIERSIDELGKKARDGKLTIEDMAGGTFTISNGGVFGSLYGTPIINLPQSAVLGMHAIKDRPIAVNGQVVVRPMMYLALTYDHRLLDGREAVTFLVKLKSYLEDPRKMLL